MTGDTMLELDSYNTIPLENLKDIATAIYVLTDDIYKAVISPEVKNRLNKDKAILSDSEIITISILGEILSNDCERAWLSYVSRNMRELFPKVCERSRFNRVKRALVTVIERIRLCLNRYVTACLDDIRIADSLPVKVCEFGRAHFCNSFKGFGATYGVCPSKKEIYYGYKFHVLCTGNGYVTDFVLTAANIDDRAAVWELVERYNRHLCMIGDKGYISASLARELSQGKGISLIYMKKDNDKNPYSRSLRRTIFKIRRRIETSFSQLAQQFKIETTKAISLLGLQARLQIKVLAFNMCFFLNQLLGVPILEQAKIKSLVF
jgi:hypothetical protein